MRKLSIMAILALGSAYAFGDWDQSQLVNVVGGGTGAIAGANLSQLETTPAETIFGFGAQTVNNNVMADDFTIGAGGEWVTSITLYTYQTGATAPSITGASWAIGAAPSTTLTASSVTNTWATLNGGPVYRVVSGDTTGSTRRIQAVEIDIADQFLAAGTYWLSYNFAGTGASGPWAPPLPTSNASHGQNAQQSLANAAFAPALVDGTTTGADLAFIVHTTSVPEPASMAALGLGALVLLRRRRK